MTDRIDRRASTGTHEDIEENVRMIRAKLGPGIGIEFHCYNYAEVEDTKALLTEEEQKHVRFFWLEFKRNVNVE